MHRAHGHVLELEPAFLTEIIRRACRLHDDDVFESNAKFPIFVVPWFCVDCI